MGKTAGRFAGRADRLESLLGKRELTHLLVTDLRNVRYLCGFTGTNGLCLVGEDLRLFFTDFRYVERAKSELHEFELEHVKHKLLDHVGTALEARGKVRLGFDDDHLSVRQHVRLTAAMPSSVELVSAGGLVERLRSVKDQDEIRAIREAATVATTALQIVVERGLVGRTEGEVAKDLAEQILASGGEDLSFPTIVAAAESSALPHAEPRDAEIPTSVLVTIDLGAKVDGYCSDMTRTFATGEVPEEAELVYNSVLAAQEVALSAVRAGVECRAVDTAARESIAAAGYGDHFGHGLGHGVGLDIHEGPTLSGRGEGELELGNVITVEPGIYLPEKFGVRVEDLVVVTERGHENLSTYPKTLGLVV